jgi:hypothetical protein
MDDFLHHWASDHSAKKVIARLVRLIIGKRQSGAESGGSEKDLAGLFQQPEFIEGAGRSIPVLINGVIGILQSAAQGLEHLPDNKRAEIVGDVLSGIDTGRLAEVFTSLSRTTGSLRSDHPAYFAEKIVPQIQNWLDHTDFGEMRELFDNAKEDYDTLIVRLGELAFEYPAKFIILLSFIPGMVNFAILFLADMAKRFNTISPDMLADILLSFFRELDGDRTGDLLNHVTEIIRQVHTGSALVGESGAPRFTMDFSSKTRTVLEKTDPVLFIKAGNALIDGRETIRKIFMDIAAENPEFLVQQLKHLAVRRNARYRMLKRKIVHIEDLPEDVCLEALGNGLTAMNTYDIADIINSLSRMANTLHHHKPEVLVSLVREFTGSLDLYEIEETARWMAAEAGQSLRPLARTLFPVIVKEFCGFFTPEDDGQDQAIQEARDMLRGFLLKEEEKSWA